MSIAQKIKCAYLAYFSKPKGDRRLYRAIRKRRARKIVQLGPGPVLRARRMIGVARARAAGDIVQFAQVDEFELRQAEPAPLSLKETHRQLGGCGARICLVPGDPFSALARKANDLTGTDLLLISAEVDAAALAPAWFYVPRMLHEGSVVLVEQVGEEGERSYSVLPLNEVQRRAQRSGTLRKAA